MVALAQTPGPGARVVVSRRGGPDVKPPGYHYCGRVLDLSSEAVRIDFENGVGQHAFSLFSGEWVEGETLALEDCVLRDSDLAMLRSNFPEGPPLARSLGDELALKESAHRGGAGQLTGAALGVAGAGQINGIRARV
jgi:hypothetical protein